MFGPRITTVFRSRWRAVWFVLSVLAGVYFTIPREDDKPDPNAQNDLQAVAALIGVSQTAHSAATGNP